MHSISQLFGKIKLRSNFNTQFKIQKKSFKNEKKISYFFCGIGGTHWVPLGATFIFAIRF
jgi:hypothetical protein